MCLVPLYVSVCLSRRACAATMCLCPQQVPTRPTTLSLCTLRVTSASHLLVRPAQHSRGDGAAKCSTAPRTAAGQHRAAQGSTALHVTAPSTTCTLRRAQQHTSHYIQHTAPCAGLVAPAQQLMHRQLTRYECRKQGSCSRPEHAMLKSHPRSTSPSCCQCWQGRMCSAITVLCLQVILV
jgi:hypothetical protein